MLKRQRKPYLSGMTDAEWNVSPSLIPGPAKLSRPPRCENGRSQLDFIQFQAA